MSDTKHHAQAEAWPAEAEGSPLRDAADGGSSELLFQDDEALELSAHASDALQQFLHQQDVQASAPEPVDLFKEDWGLSQVSMSR